MGVPETPIETIERLFSASPPALESCASGSLVRSFEAHINELVDSVKGLEIIKNCNCSNIFELEYSTAASAKQSTAEEFQDVAKDFYRQQSLSLPKITIHTDSSPEKPLADSMKAERFIERDGNYYFVKNGRDIVRALDQLQQRHTGSRSSSTAMDIPDDQSNDFSSVGILREHIITGSGDGGDMEDDETRNVGTLPHDTYENKPWPPQIYHIFKLTTRYRYKSIIILNV